MKENQTSKLITGIPDREFRPLIYPSRIPEKAFRPQTPSNENPETTFRRRIPLNENPKKAFSPRISSNGSPETAFRGLNAFPGFSDGKFKVVLFRLRLFEWKKRALNSNRRIRNQIKQLLQQAVSPQYYRATSPEHILEVFKTQHALQTNCRPQMKPKK